MQSGLTPKRVIGVLVMVALLHTRYGILRLEKMVEKKWLTERDFRKEATLDAVGWEKVPAYLEARGLCPDSTFLFAHKWMIGGQLNLEVAAKYPVYCFGNALKPVRGFAFWGQAEAMLGKHGVFITTNRYGAKADAVDGVFESITGPDTV